MGARSQDKIDLYEAIGNPDKMTSSPVTNTEEQGDDEAGSISDLSFDSRSLSSAGGTSVDSNDTSEEVKSDVPDVSNNKKYAMKRRQEEVAQEKIELLSRISRLSHEGFTATKKWSLKDDLDDVRFECYRMTRESNTRKSLKTMQHILITIATVIEFANSAVNPFNLRLDGFSKNLMLTVSDYDDSLEQLHHKWSGRTSVGPEMTLLFTFVTSAIFHHAGNVMTGTTSTTTPGPRKPDVSSLLSLFSKFATSNPKPKPKPKPESETETKPIPKATRRSMKGPSSSTNPFVSQIPSMKLPS